MLLFYQSLSFSSYLVFLSLSDDYLLFPLILFLPSSPSSTLSPSRRLTFYTFRSSLPSFFSARLQHLIRRQCFQLKRQAPVCGRRALQRFNLMQTWLLVWSYMQTIACEVDVGKKKTCLQMVLSMVACLESVGMCRRCKRGVVITYVLLLHLGEKVYFYQHHIAKEMWARGRKTGVEAAPRWRCPVRDDTDCNMSRFRT